MIYTPPPVVELSIDEFPRPQCPENPCGPRTDGRRRRQSPSLPDLDAADAPESFFGRSSPKIPSPPFAWSSRPEVPPTMPPHPPPGTSTPAHKLNITSIPSEWHYSTDATLLRGLRSSNKNKRWWYKDSEITEKQNECPAMISEVPHSPPE